MPKPDMHDIESWNHRELVMDFLSDRLTAGHVLPFLGSGVSYFANLPDWDKMLLEVASSKNASYVVPDVDPYIQAELTMQVLFPKDEQEFYAALHRVLFADVPPTFLNVIRANEGMRALAMLCNRSVRGGSRFIATLNYDDILELMLRDLGLVVHSVGEDRFLMGNSDVSVLHPHGLLRLADKDKDMERRVVAAQSSGQQIKDSSWPALLTVLLSKSFPVFIGIGGKDLFFLNYLDEARKSNYMVEVAELPYCGIRLCGKDDKFIPIFEGKKIKCITFEQQGIEWPVFVADVCRRAADQAEANIHSI